MPKTNSSRQRRTLAGATAMLEWMGGDDAAIFGYWRPRQLAGGEAFRAD